MPMLKDPSTKYKKYTPLHLHDRTWPSKTIDKPPIWLSTDMRDGNQALVNPMTIEQKSRFFDLLVRVGFKEIEVAYPAASDTEFKSVRDLIENNKIPDDVWIQVLTPAREDLIRRTIEAVAGAKQVIFHMYNATCPCFRDAVFRYTKEQTVNLAVTHTKLIRELTDQYSDIYGTKFRYEYTAETFNQTEPDFAIEICNAVLEAWGKAGPGEDRIIFNLPATIEIATPNHYADQIEHFCRHVNHRQHVIVCLHPHNDRGTAVAAAELAMMAGADRVEGCIFGNGERTGNVDLAILALNLYTQGVQPLLDFSDIQDVIETVKSCTNLPIHPRHPYAGELVFSAFSGSHQDAIKKGLEAQARRHKEAALKGENQYWDIPYLPIDPADVGCTYEAIIRVNSQSGKGGTAYIIKQALSLDIPKGMQVNFYQVIQSIADKEAREMTVEDIVKAFQRTYVSESGRISLQSFEISPTQTPVPPDVEPDSDLGEIGPGYERRFDGTLLVDGVSHVIHGDGNGPLSALLDALKIHLGIDFVVREYSEHSIGEGSDVRAASYVELVEGSTKLESATTSPGFWGVGIDSDIVTSGLRAVLNAVNNAIGKQPLPALKPSVAVDVKSYPTDVSNSILDTLGLELPLRLQSSFLGSVQHAAKETKEGLSSQSIAALFIQTYRFGMTGRVKLKSFQLTTTEEGRKAIRADVLFDGEARSIVGLGNVPLSAFLASIQTQLCDGTTLSVRDFSECSIGEGSGRSETNAASYVELQCISGDRESTSWGVAADGDITRATFEAAICAINGFDLGLFTL